PASVRCYLFHSSRGPRPLHSFPTRRSSDLAPSTRTRTPMPSVSPSETASTSPFFVATCWARRVTARVSAYPAPAAVAKSIASPRSEEHTSELQSRRDLVCRLLLEKKKKKTE